MKQYIVSFADRAGCTADAGTFTTPGTALAFAEKQRAQYGRERCYYITDADNEEDGDIEGRLEELACDRFGAEADRCVLDCEHSGPCQTSDGRKAQGGRLCGTAPRFVVTP